MKNKKNETVKAIETAKTETAKTEKPIIKAETGKSETGFFKLEYRDGIRKDAKPQKKIMMRNLEMLSSTALLLCVSATLR